MSNEKTLTIKAITVKDAINNIKEKNYVLPSIQREFVWGTDKIELFFDSLMRDYPIGTFLFWQIARNKIRDFQFYEFLTHYHEENNKHNEKTDLSDNKDIVALLDGQQRMTSLYIALCSFYAKRKSSSKISSKAYPEMKLYLNVLHKPLDDSFETSDKKYQFRFLTSEEAATKNKLVLEHWFDCTKILKIDNEQKMQEYLQDHKLLDVDERGSLAIGIAKETLNKFFEVIHSKLIINYYLERGDELEKALQIFIRVNNQGVPLSHSDLLFSIATAHWKKRDARRLVSSLVKKMNRLGDGFTFDKDTVLKACLVLCDFNAQFKVDNFTKKNMEKIEDNWDGIESSLMVAVELIANFGFSSVNLPAKTAIIPIAYFIYINNFIEDILDSSARVDDRKSIREWLARTILKGTFGATSDSLISSLRKIIASNLGRFPLKEISEEFKGKSKSIEFNEEDIDPVLDLKYSNRKTYAALTILYPSLNHNFNYDKDHIFAKSLMDKNSLRRRNYSEAKIAKYRDEMDKLPNIQLLESGRNGEKSAMLFDEWLGREYPNEEERNNFLVQNHIDLDQDLNLDSFLEFFEARKKRLKEKLIKELNVRVLGADDSSDSG